MAAIRRAGMGATAARGYAPPPMEPLPSPPAATRNTSPAAVWAASAPLLFVVLWATGFIAAKAGLPFAEPLTFLTVRFALVIAVMLAFVLAVGAPWPARWAEAGHLAVVGLFMHAGYLGGVFCAIAAGLPAGISSLIVGLQPLLTAAVVGPLLGERVGARQWAGLVLGLAGVVLVLGGKFGRDVPALGVALSFLALVGITAGTLYQKRFCAHADLRSGAVIQYLAAGVVIGVLAASLETMRVTWSWPFAAALLWLSLPLSVGAISLLYWLIRHGAAAKVASLFYLVPPVTAVFAWALFGETLGPVALAGMALAAIGVAVVQRG